MNLAQLFFQKREEVDNQRYKEFLDVYSGYLKELSNVILMTAEYETPQGSALVYVFEKNSILNNWKIQTCEENIKRWLREQGFNVKSKYVFEKNSQEIKIVIFEIFLPKKNF